MTEKGVAFRWKKEAVEALLDCLINIDDEKLRGANISITQLWDAAAIAASTVQGTPINPRAAKSKRDILKREYKIWTTLLAQPGFKRDLNGNIVGPDTLWDAYFKTHPEAKKFKNSQIEYEEQLDELFPNDRENITGSLRPSKESVEMDDDEQECEKDLEMINAQMSGLDDTIYDDVSDETHYKTHRLSTSASAQQNVHHEKKNHTNRMTEVLNFTDTLDDLVSDMKSSIEMLQQFSAEQATPTEKAVKIFLEEFSDWPVEHQVRVAEALESDVKARIFLLGSPEFRKSWADRIVERLDEKEG